jgi:hypothetical protein
MAARLPDVPSNINTAISGLNVIISWSVPYNGGTNLMAYSILIMQSDNITYT